VGIQLNGKRKARQTLRSARRRGVDLSDTVLSNVIRGIKNGILRDAARRGETISGLGLRVKTAEILEKWQKVGLRKKGKK